jgi:Uma2 family endonuclease
MAVASPLLTYEDYMCGREEMRRYDILDGVKVYMPNPTINHQRTLRRVASVLERYEETSRRGVAIVAPCDVLMRRNPLRIRQPDVLFISSERLGNRSLDDPAPLSPAPELVVEILSPSDTIRVLEGKLADYVIVDVKECWVVRRGERTVEVLRLAKEGIDSVAVYAEGETVQSLAFPDLMLDVSEIFVP